MPERKRKVSPSRKQKKRPDIETRLKTITRERKELEKAKNYSETVMSTMREPLVVLDADFRVVSANKTFYESFSVNQADVEGKVVFELGDKAWDLPKLRERLREVVTKGNTIDSFFVEHDFPVIGERALLVNARPMTEESGQINKIVVTFNDVTDLKKAEQLLRDSEEKYRNIVETTEEGILIFSIDGRILFVNQKMADMLGYPGEEIVGRTGLEFMPKDQEALVIQVRAELEKGKRINQEFQFCRKDGSILWTIANGSRLVDSAGQYIGNLAMHTDITERRKAEEELRKTQEELEARVQERTKELREAGEKLKARAEQQLVVAQLGLQAAQGIGLYELFDEAVRRIARTLDVEYCKVLELLPDKKELLLRAGVGWKEELVGQATVGTGTDSQAGYTLMSDKPIVVEDLTTEKRFSGTSLLHEHKVVSGMSVIISGHEKPFGVLGAHTTEHRTFTEDDVNFLQAVANVLATAIENRRSEEKLRAASLYTRSLIEASLDPLVTINAEGKITDVNKATEDVTGFSREQLIGTDFHDYFIDTEEAKKGYMHVFAEGFVRDYPLAIRHKSGKITDVLYNATVYRNEAGEIQGVFAAARDITERKKAEEALRKAHEELETRVEERTRELKQSTWELQAEVAERKKAEEGLRETRGYLENLIDYANAPIIVWDPDYRITRFNHAFERLTGLKAEDTLGKRLEILFPEDSKDESLEHILRATSGARWETVEIPILRTDGLVRTVLWNSANILGKDGTTVVATIAQGEDITQRKQALQSLRESQRDLNRAQAVAKTGSWRLDVRNNTLLWSDETHRMFGISKGTPLTYENFLNFVHPEDRKYVNDKWQAATRGEPYDIEHRIIVNGQIRWVREKAELEFDKDGTTTGGFGTVQEITEVKEMQAKLQEYSQHLEQLVEEKTQKLKESERLATIGETASMVGHDIRNPLQSIEGAVYLAKEEIKALPDGSPEKKELHEILDIIRHQTNYIDHIVADLQDFSRTPMPQLRETDLHELVTEAISTLEIPENIELQTLIQDDLRTVKVDPVFIKRVILNLVENAAHAMPNGGKLTIRAFCDDERVHIHVEDTGTGISEENKLKVFTPLFTTKSKGQGFGLAVCKKLVEAHNGEIIFESEAGKGTVFKIKLPQGEQTRQDGQV